MRSSTTLARTRAGKVARVTALGHYIPGFVFHAARCGYDCIWLDLEHRDLSILHVQSLIASAHRCNIDVMVRPPTADKVRLYRYLEEGAAGLLIPQVSDAQQAAALVAAAKFPPLGERGIDNAGLDADYAIHPVEAYVDWANRETFLAVQIETVEGVRNVGEIAATPGVDMLFVGPGDLGFRLNQSQESSLEDAVAQVAAACRKHNKPWGCPALEPDLLAQRYDQGARFLVAASDHAAYTTELQHKSTFFAKVQ